MRCSSVATPDPGPGAPIPMKPVFHGFQFPHHGRHTAFASLARVFAGRAVDVRRMAVQFSWNRIADRYVELYQSCSRESNISRNAIPAGR
jgi:hypothetical protein